MTEMTVRQIADQAMGVMTSAMAQGWALSCRPDGAQTLRKGPREVQAPGPRAGKGVYARFIMEMQVEMEKAP